MANLDQSIVVRLPAELREALFSRARDEQRKPSELARMLIAEGLARRAQRKGTRP